VGHEFLESLLQIKLNTGLERNIVGRIQIHDVQETKYGLVGFEVLAAVTVTIQRPVVT
jgi:hypothetical protein